MDNRKMIYAGAVGGVAVFSLIWLACAAKKKKIRCHQLENQNMSDMSFEEMRDQANDVINDEDDDKKHNS